MSDYVNKEILQDLMFAAHMSSKTMIKSKQAVGCSKSHG